jgi:Family of unknown function (DUF6304)
VGHLITFPGSYQDAHGTEAVTWTMSTDPLHSWDLRTTIRGIPVRGGDWDCLEVSDYQAARRAGMSVTDEGDGPFGCRLSAELPCMVEARDGSRLASVVSVSIDLGSGGAGDAVRMSVEDDGVVHTASGDDFDQCMGRLAKLVTGRPLVCCRTCRWSSNFPHYQPTMGLACHRDAKPQVIAAWEIARRHAEMRAEGRTDPTLVSERKAAWQLPVAETVAEFYLCSQYEPRSSFG